MISYNNSKDSHLFSVYRVQSLNGSLFWIHSSSSKGWKVSLRKKHTFSRVKTQTSIISLGLYFGNLAYFSTVHEQTGTFWNKLSRMPRYWSQRRENSDLCQQFLQTDLDLPHTRRDDWGYPVSSANTVHNYKNKNIYVTNDRDVFVEVHVTKKHTMILQKRYN